MSVPAINEITEIEAAFGTTFMSTVEIDPAEFDLVISRSIGEPRA